MGFLGVHGGRPDLAYWVYRPHPYWACPTALEFRVWGSGFRVQGLGFRVWGSGFRV